MLQSQRRHNSMAFTPNFQVEMERRDFGSKIRGGLVRAAINQYGDRKGDGISWKKSLPKDSEYSSKAGELQKAKTDIDHYKESRNAADSLKAQAQLELLNAKSTVKKLSSLFEKSNATTQAHKWELETLKKSGWVQERRVAVASCENHEYAELLRELEFAKQELSKLKLDVASVADEKLQAEKVKEAAISKLQSFSSSIEELRKEIDERNEEQVLVELAQIEALKEFQEIEAQRAMEANEFLCAIENKRKIINDLVQEIEAIKELENKLSVTMSDVNVLQRELKLVKELDIKAQRKVMMTELERKSDQVEEDELLLQSITEKLKTAKKDLASIRDEGFQFMTSMDAVRWELKHVKEEIANLKKPDDKTDSIVQKLNSKLLRTKAKLEAVSSTEEKAKAMASNLSLTIEQMKKETEAAKKEKELTVEEIKNTKAEIQKTESEIDLNEERLQDALRELEMVKSSEALALAKLKSLTESTMRFRATATKNSSFITISSFEYEYLAGHAVAAQEIADKKVAAAQAWTEAIKASEIETIKKYELAQLEINEMRMEEEKLAYRTSRSLSAKRMVEGELQNWRQKREKNAEAENLPPAIRQKSIRRNGSMTPARRLKFRISASPSPHMMNGTTTFSTKKRRKVVKNLAKFFNGKKADMNP